MDEISNFIDNYLRSKNLIEIKAVDANAILAKAGILGDNKDKPGKPLRALLRKGKLPHAYQNGNRWLIPLSQKVRQISTISESVILVEKEVEPRLNKTINVANLLNDDQFKSTKEIDSVVPDQPGIYCIRIINPDKLPKSFKDNLLGRKHDILYIGIASKSLKKRFLNQELRAKGHGTFFRSLGATLGYQPVAGSLIGKANTRNFKFSDSDTLKIISWVNLNLMVNWIVTQSNLEELENELIQEHLPLMNIAKNPSPFSLLSTLRSECIRIANTSM